MTLRLMLSMPVPEPETLSQRLVQEIEDAAKKRGLSQKGLLGAAKLGDGSPAVQATAFNSWKNGTSSPTVEKLEALCRVVEKHLVARVGPRPANTSALAPEALEAAEHIDLLEARKDRERARDAVIRMVAAMREKRKKASG